MNWILIAYLVVLVYLLTHRERLPNPAPLQSAWIWFAVVPLLQFLFSLFRAGNSSDGRDLALVEIWADGFTWLCLGISLLCLTRAFAGPQAASAPPAGTGTVQTPSQRG